MKRILLVCLILVCHFALYSENTKANLSMNDPTLDVSFATYIDIKGFRYMYGPRPEGYIPELNRLGINLLFTNNIGNDFKIYYGFEAGVSNTLVGFPVYINTGFSKEFYIIDSFSIEPLILAYAGVGFRFYAVFPPGSNAKPVDVVGAKILVKINWDVLDNFRLFSNLGIDLSYYNLGLFEDYYGKFAIGFPFQIGFSF
ncbi:MAG: hypothetical protein HQ557_06440 [Bacteroidetes bacterium]|nr:hypothetical protein [Bacteroidota bacterium]